MAADATAAVPVGQPANRVTRPWPRTTNGKICPPPSRIVNGRMVAGLPTPSGSRFW